MSAVDVNLKKTNDDAALAATFSPGARMKFAVAMALLVVAAVELLGVVAYIFLITPDKRERLELMLDEGSTWRNSAARFRAHPFLQYVGNADFRDPSGFAPFADDGFRHPDARASKNPAMRVVVLGGSTTYGILAQTTEESWPAMLGENLRKQGLDVDVRNAGIPSYNSWHLVAAASFFLKSWNPDVVILHTGFNDAFARAYPDEGGVDARRVMKPYDIAELGSVERRLLSLSRAARVVMLPKIERDGRLVGDLTGEMFREEPSPDDMARAAQSASGTTFRANVETLIALIRAVGATVVLMPEPANVDDVGRPPWFEIAFQGAKKNADILQELASANEIPFVDLRDRFNTGRDFVDDVHLTDENERVRAALIAPAIADVLKGRAVVVHAEQD